MSDGGGLAQGLEWKGGPALRPCFCCGNVWALNSDLASRRRDHIEIDACRLDSFRLKSQLVLFDEVDQVLDAIARVERGEPCKTRLKELCKAFGTNLTEHGLLTMPALRGAGMHPGDLVRYDWVCTTCCKTECFMWKAAFSSSTPAWTTWQIGTLDS